MSIILSEYNEETRKDRCWYDSSNVFYSICDDKLDDLKDLTVVFDDGRSYFYEKIHINDYVLWKNSSSQGKALYKYIAVKDKGVPRYKTTRLENYDLGLLNTEKKRIIEEREIKAKLLVERQMKEKEIENALCSISSVDIDPEFIDIVNDNFDDLIK